MPSQAVALSRYIPTAAGVSRQLFERGEASALTCIQRRIVGAAKTRTLSSLR